MDLELLRSLVEMFGWPAAIAVMAAGAVGAALIGVLRMVGRYVEARISMDAQDREEYRNALMQELQKKDLHVQQVTKANQDFHLTAIGTMNAIQTVCHNGFHENEEGQKALREKTQEIADGLNVLKGHIEGSR